LRRVICDLSNVPYVDIAGARMLRRLYEELSAMNVDLKIVEAHGPTRDLLRAEGIETLVGSITRYGNIAELIAERNEVLPAAPVASG
jgi:anti-anti-sigma regulatory factor